MKRLAALAAVVCLVPALTSCAGPASTDAVGRSVAATFAGLYAQQQQLVGRTDVTRAGLRPFADCRRTGLAVDGPGDDWSCIVQYDDLGAAAQQGFEVQVRTDGCWRADAPTSAQPVQLAEATTDRYVDNPLRSFDGCLDPSW